MIGRRAWVPWLWLAPALLLSGAFLLYPTVDTIRQSLIQEGSDAYFGLDFDNYRFIIDNPEPLVADTHAALLNNFLWLILFTAVTVALGLIIAVLTARVRYEAVAKSAIFIPMAISFVAASVIWKFMYEFNADIGTVNAVLTEAGGNATRWLQDTGSPQTPIMDAGPDTLPAPLHLNNFSLIFVGVWMWTGFAMIVLSAGLKGISTEILEAARVDGANEWQIFWRIIIPNLSPTIVVVATTLVIQALKNFDLVWVMTAGRFETDLVATLFYKEASLFGNPHLGAALAIVLLLCIVPIMVISIRRFQFQEETR
jgi:alpha-glucoside transport system permease protein